MRDVITQPQSWTVAAGETDESPETEAVAYSFSYARV